MYPSLASALRSNRLVRVFGMGQLCHPKLLEIVAYSGGFDAVWLDQEHAGLTLPQIEEATRAARASGIDTFVRLPASDYATVMRVLEAGSSGVMASMIRRVEEVENLVRWARFHPAGQRGVNGSGVDGRYGQVPLAEYFRLANEQTVLGVQVEHQDAVEAIDRIVAVPEVDFYFIGPADLSQSMGIPGDWENPRLWQAIERVAKACGSVHRPWGVMVFHPLQARRCRDLGARILGIGMDVWACQRGVQWFKGEYEEFFQA